jgi:iron(III) transport system substrate-binding protein
MGKLAAEFSAGAPKADVLLLADAATMEALKKDGRLMPYPQAKVDGLDPGVYDADRTYFGSKLITTGIAVNTGAKSRPTSWADLAKPEYKGQIAMPSPLYSGAAAIMLGTMTSRPDLGWSYFEKLKAADAVAVRGNGAVRDGGRERREGVRRAGRLHGVQREGEGLADRLRLPAEGLPAVPSLSPFSRRRRTPRPPRAFVDFILSDEGPEARGVDGLHSGESQRGMPAWYPPGVKIHLMPTDIPKVVQTNSANLKRFSELFGN